MGLFDAFKKKTPFDAKNFFADIENKVYDAMKKDVESILKMVGHEELYAMALVTDEDCVSLYFAANTLEKAREKDQKYAEMLKARLKEEEVKAVKDGTKSFVKWIPDEWAYSIGKNSPFTEISKTLLKQDERNAEEYAKNKPMFFECLTTAMKKFAEENKARNGFGNITYFITLCDGDGIEEFKDLSAKQINSPEVYERFMKRKENRL